MKLGIYTYADCGFTSNSLTIPEGVSMSEHTFANYKHLTKLFIEDNVSINNSFTGCDSLTFIGMLGTDYSSSSFNINKMDSVKKVLCMSTTPPTATLPSSVKAVFVPDEGEENFWYTSPWKDFKVIPLHGRTLYTEESQLSTNGTINLNMNAKGSKVSVRTNDSQSSGMWTLEDADEGLFYLKTAFGSYLGCNGSDTNATLPGEQSDAAKIKISWYAPEAGFVLQDVASGAYLSWNDFKWTLGDITEYMVYDITSALPRVSSITLNHTENTIARTKTVQLSADISPSTAENQTLKWKSSDTSVATVNSDGLVTGVKVGTAIITATSTDGTNISASCTITVIPYCLSSVKLNLSNVTKITDESFQLTASVYPSDVDDPTLTWSSSNENVAIVAQDGFVYTIGPGQCYIYATANDGGGARGQCLVTVNPRQATSMKLTTSSVSLGQGETYKMTYTIKPTNATYQTLEWTSSNTSVFTVDDDGVIYAVGIGKAILTAKTIDDSNLTDRCIVTVTASAGIDGVTMDDNEEGTAYYQLDGVKLSGKPQQEGVYIRVKDGKSQKIVIRKK